VLLGFVVAFLLIGEVKGAEAVVPKVA